MWVSKQRQLSLDQTLVLATFVCVGIPLRMLSFVCVGVCSPAVPFDVAAIHLPSVDALRVNIFGAFSNYSMIVQVLVCVVTSNPSYPSVALVKGLALCWAFVSKKT